LILDYNFKIKELERGDSFGEIALMKDISRSASIVTTT
jgi:CRP-like cAMP-binding protein